MTATTMVLGYLLGCLIVGKMTCAEIYRESNSEILRAFEDRLPGIAQQMIVASAILWPLTLIMTPAVDLYVYILAKVHAKKAQDHDDRPPGDE